MFVLQLPASEPTYDTCESQKGWGGGIYSSTDLSAASLSAAGAFGDSSGLTVLAGQRLSWL